MVALAALGASITAASLAAVDQRQGVKWVLTGFVLADVGIITGVVGGYFQRKARLTLLESVNLYNQVVDDRLRCGANAHPSTVRWEP
jgi:hypothetical protein